MKWMFAAVIASAIAIVRPPGVEAKGCMTGAIVGGAAMAGHGKLGATVGCVVGHHEANKQSQQLGRPGAFRSEVRPWPSKGMPPGRCSSFRCSSASSPTRLPDAC